MRSERVSLLEERERACGRAALTNRRTTTEMKCRKKQTAKSTATAIATMTTTTTKAARGSRKRYNNDSSSNRQYSYWANVCAKWMVMQATSSKNTHIALWQSPRRRCRHHHQWWCAHHLNLFLFSISPTTKMPPANLYLTIDAVEQILDITFDNGKLWKCGISAYCVLQTLYEQISSLCTVCEWEYMCLTKCVCFFQFSCTWREYFPYLADHFKWNRLSLLCWHRLLAWSLPLSTPSLSVSPPYRSPLESFCICNRQIHFIMSYTFTCIHSLQLYSMSMTFFHI